MNWLDMLTESSASRLEMPRIYGVVIALVTNNQDPQNLGRVKLSFPWLTDNGESDWARVATPMAGKDRGFYFLPEVNDEVLVAFEQGDPNYPYVIGALWNGKDKPPETNRDGKNDVRAIRSRSGHVIRLNDQSGAETIEIIDNTGNNQITINTAKNTITIQSHQDIKLAAPNGAITLEARKIQLQATTALNLQSSTEMNAKTDGFFNLKGGLINLN
jgi:uncharacterized protein involved in type VI secretion and phage assembly